MKIDNIERLLEKYKSININKLDLYREYSFYTVTLKWDNQKALNVLISRYFDSNIKLEDNDDKILFDDINYLSERLEKRVNRRGFNLSDKNLMERIMNYCNRYRFKPFPDLEKQLEVIKSFRKIKDEN